MDPTGSSSFLLCSRCRGMMKNHCCQCCICILQQCLHCPIPFVHWCSPSHWSLLAALPPLLLLSRFLICIRPWWLAGITACTLCPAGSYFGSQGKSQFAESDADEMGYRHSAEIRCSSLFWKCILGTSTAPDFYFSDCSKQVAIVDHRSSAASSGFGEIWDFTLPIWRK